MVRMGTGLLQPTVYAAYRICMHTCLPHLIVLIEAEIRACMLYYTIAIYTLYTRYIHAIYTLYTHYIHAIYTLYTRYIHAIYTLYTRYIHAIYTKSSF